MKKVNINMRIMIMVIIMVGSISSCNKQKVVPPDPAGTITTNLSSPIILYQGLATTPYVTVYNTYPYVLIALGMDCSTLNTGMQTKIGTDGGGYTNFQVDADDISATNIGTVDGLGSVTQKPASGYTASCLLEVGHGYVVRYKKSYMAPSDGQYYYARFYVQDWVLNTGNGIIGAKITFQNPY